MKATSKIPTSLASYILGIRDPNLLTHFVEHKTISEC